MQIVADRPDQQLIQRLGLRQGILARAAEDRAQEKMMDVLLLTNRPAPMMPPIEIMVRWRGFKERESSFFPVFSAGFDTVISCTSVDERTS